ncbi:VOC family protein [Pseudahrensia aquimaris]|uniref:VOC family protein n=1 Tax=Pseudahrensia aquimaris TaxID=744461 RepID=A0ABW3FKA2_9HYPH
MSITQKPRVIDHLVLPVIDIDVARARYEQLGFTVAPNGTHPFGTENACVFFNDDTFLEPIAVAHRETCEAAALKGNTFVANDQAYRFRRGQEGFSHLVIKTDDASADHKDYVKAAISGGSMVRFSRPFKTLEGKRDKASFKLAFAADRRAPDAGFFACEVVSAPRVDQTALKTHANGAQGLLEVVISEPNPSDFQYFLQDFLDQREMDNNSFGIEFESGNTKVSVLSPDGMRAFYGLEAEKNERGLRLTAYVIGVVDLASVEAHLIQQRIAASVFGDKLVVPPSAGQGCTIAFQEVSA